MHQGKFFHQKIFWAKIKLLFPRQLLAMLALSVAILLLVMGFNWQFFSPAQLSTKPTSTPKSEQQSQSLWQQIYDLSFTGENIFPQHCGNLSQTNWVAFLDTTAQKLIYYDNTHKRFELIALPPTSPAQALAVDNLAIFVYTDAVYRYDLRQKNWQRLTDDLLSLPVSGLHTFGGNLYLTGQGIFKRLNFNAAGKYENWTSWLAPEQEEKFSPQGIYISDYVYAAWQNKLQRLARGQPTNWQLMPSPELPGKLLITGQKEQLAIVCPQTATIMITNTKGELIWQQTNPLLSHASCLYFDEQLQNYVVVSEGKLYQLTATFLE